MVMTIQPRLVIHPRRRMVIFMIWHKVGDDAKCAVSVKIGLALVPKDVCRVAQPARPRYIITRVSRVVVGRLAIEFKGL